MQKAVAMIKKMKRSVLIFCVSFVCFVGQLFAAEAFVVKQISVEGATRISANTVLSYLPIKVGQRLSPEETAATIDALYQTGFFERITLSRKGSTLVVRVVERPTIGRLKITGNSAIPTDKLKTVMKGLGVVEGRIYNKVTLEKIRQGLLNQYYLLGRYNARVDIKTTPMPNNRVEVAVTISEGLIARVQRINIIGNHVFTQKELIKQLDLSTPGITTFITQKDRFSQEKLTSSLDHLRDFYMDRGYIRFSAKSSEVAITPDRKSIFITIVIDEGLPYHIKAVHIVGDTILPREDLLAKMHIHAGDLFSRTAAVNAEKTMSDMLGEEGYIFAEISLQPVFDDKTQQVTLNFSVRPGKKIYVRHIAFTDNNKTNDNVLRRQLSQMEAAPVSSKRLNNSKTFLNRLPYIKDVEMSVLPVQASDDQVDVNYKVKEDSAAQASVSLSYGQVGHLGFGAGLNQKNFRGTGNTLGFNFSRNQYQQYYGIDYTNPFYTPEGISRSFSLTVQKFNPHYANLTSGYTDDQYAFSVLYGIPVGQEGDVTNRLQLGYGYQETKVRLSSNPQNVSDQLLSFINDHGRQFQELELIGGFTRDSRDKAIFPTMGMLHTFGANVFLPITHRSLKYYLMSYDVKWYHPIIGKFIATARGNVGYGNSLEGPTGFPFFSNFYAGGIGSVGGYTSNTLGPRDSLGNPTGGNTKADGGFGIVFPNPISENLRTLLFLNGGNAYNTYNNHKYNGTGSGPLRYSTGLEADWLSPLGLIDLSFGKALNPRPGDETKFFDFSLGANFG